MKGTSQQFDQKALLVFYGCDGKLSIHTARKALAALDSYSEVAAAWGRCSESLRTGSSGVPHLFTVCSLFLESGGKNFLVIVSPGKDTEGGYLLKPECSSECRQQGGND